MNKESLSKLKKELIYILSLFVLSIILFKAVFYKEQIIVVIRVVAGFFWLFVLPGFSLMYYWDERLDFIERFLIGIAASMAIIGILSYHIGLIGLHIKYHALILPLIILVGGILIIWRKLSVSNPSSDTSSE